MPSKPPPGEPAPLDGRLPDFVQPGQRPFGIYLHVPFCASRCGYCDFNTYVESELVSGSQGQYAEQAIAEIRFARQALGAEELPVATVFVGGGTPTLLAAETLNRMLAAIDAEFGLAAGAEVTVEANPDSVTPSSLADLRAGGFNRISFGMQSNVPQVLETLDRTHTPGAALEAARWAVGCGFEHVNLDVIYGTPGESDEDWRETLAAVVAAPIDHVSAYALIVEDGTKLARKVAIGQLAAPDDDVLADRYLIAEEAMLAAGLKWYEVSNWARPGGQCRHNLGYWQGHDWWGIGPGAHSHVDGVRWWNVRHPRNYAQLLASGQSPAQARECLTETERYDESVLLKMRMRGGIRLSELRSSGQKAVTRLLADGLLASVPGQPHGVELTLRGRLLADLVVRGLLV
jgi:putative oxygen-independent coproporphyrinogen III oxidase